MSLSKYFKDSSSFKREKIVKSSTSETEGWQSKLQPSATPFKPGNISVPDKTGPASSAHQLPPQPTKNEEAKTTPPASPDASKTVSTPSVDLSNYISLEEAEEKAQAMYQQGAEDGVLKASQDYGSATNALITACEQIESIRETIINNSSNELMEFALLIAEKILRISLKEQDQTIIATVEEALQRAVKSEEFTIYIHPDDYETISTRSEDFVAAVSGLSNIIIHTDITIERGGAKIESENCIIDATIISQFESIREELGPAKE